MEEVVRLYELLVAPQEPFKEGDVIVWKPGLKNFQMPNYDQSAVVTKVLSEPIIDATEGPGSPYYNVSCDIVVGLICSGDGSFREFHVSSNRFQLRK